MKKIYFDVCNYEDYDKMVEYFLEKKIEILERNKENLFISAEVPETFKEQMIKEVSFSEPVSFGNKPLLDF